MVSSFHNSFEGSIDENFDQYFDQYFDQAFENLFINYGDQEDERKAKKKMSFYRKILWRRLYTFMELLF